MDQQETRRKFIETTAALMAGMAVWPTAAQAAAGIPTRAFGKTGMRVPILAMGCAASGQSPKIPMEDTLACFKAALDEGMTYFDCARIYGHAEDAVGQLTSGIRDELIITTKVAANSVQEAENSLAESLKKLKTDHVDVLFWHDVSFRDTTRGLAADGIVDWLEKQKSLGKALHIGCTSHAKPVNMKQMIESGRMECCIMAMNFVDHEQYHFEEICLPLAKERKMGVSVIKVYGGVEGKSWDRYVGPAKGAQMPTEYLQLAQRYVLSLPGVSAAIVGMHTPEQVKQNVAWAKTYRPLLREEREKLHEIGQQLVGEWTPRFGPTE